MDRSPLALSNRAPLAVRSLSSLVVSLLVSLVVALSPASARADGDQSTQKRNGFVLTVGFDAATSFLISGSGNQFVQPIGDVSGHIFAGAKLDRVMVGLNLRVSHASHDESTTAVGVTQITSDAVTLLGLLPGVRLALVRSSDRRVELFAQADVGWGRPFQSSSQTPPAMMPPAPQTTTNQVLFDVGPGVRYWLHRQIALSAVALLRGTYELDSTTRPAQSTGGADVTENDTYGALSIGGSIDLSGVF